MMMVTVAHANSSVALSQNAINLGYGKQGNNFDLQIQYDDDFGIITAVEFANVQDKNGYLITVEGSDDIQSVFLTSAHQIDKAQVKATLGAMQQELYGTNVRQLFAGIDMQGKLSDRVKIGTFVNATRSQDTQLQSSTTTVDAVQNGRQGTLTTTISPYFNSSSVFNAGLSGEMIINPKLKLSATAGLHRLDGDNDYSLNTRLESLVNDNKTRLALEGLYANNHQQFKGSVDHLIGGGFAIG